MTGKKECGAECDCGKEECGAECGVSLVTGKEESPLSGSHTATLQHTLQHTATLCYTPPLTS